MLDVFDFIVEKGGNPQKIRDSQKRRYASEEVVDEVIVLYEDHRKSKFEHSSTLRRALTYSVCSSVLSDPNKLQNQRDPKANWCQKESERKCR
jgi:hypothetical protein